MIKLEDYQEPTISKATQIFKLLSDPNRLKIVTLLADQPLNVSTIAENLNMEQSATSHQLKLLYDGNILKKQRDGKAIYYSPTDTHVYNIIEQVLRHAKED